jgi:hypothetical protein
VDVAGVGGFVFSGILVGVLIGAAFGTFLAPVLPAIVEGDDVNPAFAEMLLEQAEADGGGEVEAGGGEDAGDDPRALDVDVAGQTGRDNAAQCQGRSPKRQGTKRIASKVPVQRSQGEPLGREWSQVQPRPASQTGSRKAVRPIDCRSRSLPHAPIGPTQLPTACGPDSPEAVFIDGSVACQVLSESSSRSETSSSSSPRKTLSGRLRVGDRTMETGFMGVVRSPRKGAHEAAASGGEEEHAESRRASLIIGGGEVDFVPKSAGGI